MDWRQYFTPDELAVIDRISAEHEARELAAEEARCNAFNKAQADREARLRNPLGRNATQPTTDKVRIKQALERRIACTGYLTTAIMGNSPRPRRRG